MNVVEVAMEMVYADLTFYCYYYPDATAMIQRD